MCEAIEARRPLTYAGKDSAWSCQKTTFQAKDQPAFCQHLSPQSPRQLVGEYTEAWKILKLHNQPLHLGHLTLFIASCPRKPFTDREALRGVSGTWWVACPRQAEVPQLGWKGQQLP